MDTSEDTETTELNFQGLPVQTYTSQPRLFKGRHIQMMALGVSIGTGIYYRTGQYLELAGPVSLLLAFLLMGTVLYSVLITIGEMISFLNLAGAVFSLPNRFWLPGLSFACACLYTFSYGVALADKAVAFRIYMFYWLPHVPYHVWILIFFIFPVLFNLLNVRRMGEIEFCMTVIKVLTLLAIIVFGIVVIGRGTPYLRGLDDSYKPVPCHNNNVTANCTSGPEWEEHGFNLALGSKAGTLNDTAAKVAGFWECCSVALFSYTGTELVAITAWETENPRYTLPRAVRRISYRIILYYVGAVFVLGLTVSINDPLLQLPTLPDPNGQYGNRIYPGGFIIKLAERTGVLRMAHFINAVQVIAAVSVATAHIYITSRCLCAMSYLGFTGDEKNIVTQSLQRLNRFGAPWIAVCVAAFPGTLAFLAASDKPYLGFKFIQQLTGIPIAIAWAMLCYTYLNFKKALDETRLQTVERSRSPLQPWLAYWGIFWSLMMVFFNGFKAFLGPSYPYSGSIFAVEIAPYITLIVFIILVGISRLVIGENAFETRRLTPAEVASDMTSEQDDLTGTPAGSKLKQAVVAVLNFL